MALFACRHKSIRAQTEYKDMYNAVYHTAYDSCFCLLILLSSADSLLACPCPCSICLNPKLWCALWIFGVGLSWISYGCFVCDLVDVSGMMWTTSLTQTYIIGISKLCIWFSMVSL